MAQNIYVYVLLIFWGTNIILRDDL